MKTVIEDLKAKRDSQIAELRETCEMRIEMADLRRQQTLKEKVDSAKKMVVCDIYILIRTVAVPFMQLGD